ncbi:SOS response regulatory protein OraA/RecX, interacts with RecA [Brevibacterium siliguriense]|uniref:Regulatory protein RecX n=1 Tax=Brevibacterium siliguriense TaxID=1136497 RepID=A0A1H1SFA9_9MICO|nr:regulatory protein RecX [Brevibacterium siliguriense]SDS46684.1 SOS response regulatory protein OraA/RecX, interacts with RecA [Brevibacterium siliguriense]
MTSKSPDASSTETESIDDESTASTDKAGAGDSDSTGSPQTETLSQLRSAISEIDQRHAEGETGFFAGLSGLDDDVTGGGRTGKRKSVGKTARSGTSTTTRRKKKSSSWKRPTQEPDNGWAEGGTESTPDFIDVPDFLDSGDDGGPDFAAGPGLSFDEDEDDAPDFDEDYAQAKKTAMNMLAMRDHSSDELRKKLLKRDLMPEAIDVLIEKLQNSRLLNDEEFAHRFARAQRENRKLSRSVLKRQLSKKGISPELASEAVADIDGEEELAREVAQKKADSTRRLDYAVRERRILGMLARRGFPSAICIKVTREVLAED